MRPYAAGSSFQNLRICGPVKRSIAGEPVSVCSRGPTAAPISAHSAPVELSIQIGEVLREKPPRRHCSKPSRAAGPNR